MSTRRDFLKGVGAGLLAGLLPAGTVFAGGEQRPNIILIMADDLGYGDLSCYGNEQIRTPHIDALAAGGLRFTDFHSNGAVCSPTRAALLTGRYQQRCGVDGVIYAKGPARETGMPLGETTFAEVLKRAGYATGIFGKWHLGYNVEFNPGRQGFDRFVGYVSGNVDFHSHIDGAGIEDWWRNDRKQPETGYVTDLITDHGVRFIEQNRDRPFCLYLPHEAPHYPYQGRRDKADRAPGDPQPMLGSRSDRPQAYKEMIEAMDEGVGRIVDTIRRLGLQDRTFIFFCSDNGATGPGSNAPLRGRKGGLFEGGHRVPAIARWPGRIKPGTVTDFLTLSMDLFPTMVALASIEPAPALALDGVDLSPILFGGPRPAERTVFWRYRNERVARRGPWKLLIRTKDGRETIHLFNLHHDLAERNNLADEHPERVAQLRAALLDWEQDVEANAPKARPEASQ